MFDLVPFRANRNLTKRGDAFDRLFESFLEQPFSVVNRLHTSFKVDVKDKGSFYEVTAELPGVRKEDISLQYEQKYLTISVNRDESKETKEENYVCRERHMGSMQRSFLISDVDEDKIDAVFSDGILKLELPKLTVQETKKQIAIR